MSQAPAFIHIDLDGFWTHLEYYGISHPAWPDPVFSEAVPRWLEILKGLKIKATFFVIGADLKIRQKAEMVEKIVSQGHEIANHSYNHKTPLAQLTKEQKYDEVVKTHGLIKEITGSPPKGFRSPSFSLDAELLDILEDEGYLYDSSMFGSPYGFLVQGLLNRIGAGQVRDGHSKKTDTYGKIRWTLAPTEPYKPGEITFWKEGKRNKRNIWEVPVSAIPFLKLPFHFSYILALKKKSRVLADAYSGTGINLTALLGRPLTYLFHGLELAAPESIDKIRFQPGTDIPLNNKIDGVYKILNGINSRFDVCLITDYLKELNEG